MDATLWKYIGLGLIAAHVTTFVTFVSRVFPSTSAIIFTLVALSTVILIQFHPDISSEDMWVKGVLAFMVVIGGIVGIYDYIIEFYEAHTQEVNTYLLLGFGGACVLGWMIHQSRKVE